MNPDDVAALLRALRPDETAVAKQADQLRGMLNEARQQRDRFAQELGATRARTASDIKEAANAVEEAILAQMSRAVFGAETVVQTRQEILSQIEKQRNDRLKLAFDGGRLQRFEQDVRLMLSANDASHQEMLEAIARLVVTASKIEQIKKEVQSAREEATQLRKLAGVLSGQIHRANEWLCNGGLTTPMADPRVSDPPDVREVTKFFKPSS